jgi:hypothetical protein
MNISEKLCCALTLSHIGQPEGNPDLWVGNLGCWEADLGPGHGYNHYHEMVDHDSQNCTYKVIKS